MPARYLRFQLRGVAEPKRAGLLERLLARADETGVAPDWRTDAFAVLSPGSALPPVAPVALRASRVEQTAAAPASAWVCLATPVHYVAELSNVRFAGDGLLLLDVAEATALALDFNAQWSGAGVHMWAASTRLFCGFDAALDVKTRDPESVRGQHLHDFLPAGPDAARLRRLMSEIEMWLFDHVVNQRRNLESRVSISGLWLWGGGAPLGSLPMVHGGAGGEDVLFEAFAVPENRIADVMVAAAVPGTAAWDEIESRWLEPSLAELQRGRLTRLELSAGDRRFTVSSRWRLRFWRRARPWWEYFE